MRRPKGFQLLGRHWTVRIIPKKDWKDEASVGLCSFEKCEISIMRNTPEAMEHVLLHEYLHAALDAMGSKLYSNEPFVDNLSGLLHQILTSAK